MSLRHSSLGALVKVKENFVVFNYLGSSNSQLRTLTLPGRRTTVRSTPAEKHSSILSMNDHAGPSDLSALEFHTQAKPKGKAKAKDKEKSGKFKKPNPSQSTKLRGRDEDFPEVRMSKTIAWLLRHQAENEGLMMRPDGTVKVDDILQHPKVKPTGLDFDGLKRLVQSNDKQRFELVLESHDGVKLETVSGTPPLDAEGTTQPAEKSPKGVWWIRARQGHSIKTVQLELKPILSLTDIPTGIAVHGTSKDAWGIISREGLSKMNRNHIHMAQGVAGQKVVSGMRASSQILIYIDVEKAIEGGLKFWLSANGVILSEGDENGYLSRHYFQRVVDVRHGELKGWEENSSTIPLK